MLLLPGRMLALQKYPSALLQFTFVWILLLEEVPLAARLGGFKGPHPPYDAAIPRLTGCMGGFRRGAWASMACPGSDTHRHRH